MLVHPNVLAKARKNTEKRSSLPILNYVLCSADKDEVLLSATDLETQVTFRQKAPEDAFPDAARLWPKTQTYVVTLSAVILKKLCEWACKHGGLRSSSSAAIRFYLGNDNQGHALVVEMPRKDGGLPARGLIMPLRDNLKQHNPLPKEEKKAA